MSVRYALPAFLEGIHDRAAYVRWLQRKAVAHVRRDRKRGNVTATVSSYKQAIHEAVLASDGVDAYTGEALDWRLLSDYDNATSKEQRRAYKQRFAMLPSVDHVGDGLGPADFRICAWRTNDCKNDLDLATWIDFCRKVVAHADRSAS
ncbi:hypothetical protein [Oleiagrimonas soli]|uniref:Uncharacterized protein n=1 Tax=Oleiagrimonas soli TaxID=1543381 RepID=A0A841KGI1_9GAMM|nr:hypothetical protein [Oleiagrimonas soli]MBB6184733.1 hypothetical protein [Oleiagrimonas soli]